jgi:hypothetical protein
MGLDQAGDFRLETLWRKHIIHQPQILVGVAEDGAFNKDEKNPSVIIDHIRHVSHGHKKWHFSTDHNSRWNESDRSEAGFAAVRSIDPLSKPVAADIRPSGVGAGPDEALRCSPTEFALSISIFRWDFAGMSLTPKLCSNLHLLDPVWKELLGR